MQEKYRAVAEAAVRGGQAQQVVFDTSKLTPTQPRERTAQSGSGAGAKDLPPIVIRQGGRDYLLDGHHRAGRNRKLIAMYVDVDNQRTTVGKAV